MMGNRISFIRAYEPSALCLPYHTNAKPFFGFCLRVFRHPGPPQRVDWCLHQLIIVISRFRERPGLYAAGHEHNIGEAGNPGRFERNLWRLWKASNGRGAKLVANAYVAF